MDKLAASLFHIVRTISDVAIFIRSFIWTHGSLAISSFYSIKNPLKYQTVLKKKFLYQICAIKYLIIISAPNENSRNLSKKKKQFH